MKRYFAFVSMTVFAAAATGGLVLAEEKAAAKGLVMPASELKWTDSAVMKGAKQAVLWGDPAKGAYGTLRSVPAGTALGLHTHTAAHKVVLVSGTIEFNMDGQPKKDLGPGSYVAIPGGAAHDATCKAGADCVYLEEGSTAADYKPVVKK